MSDWRANTDFVDGTLTVVASIVILIFSLETAYLIHLIIYSLGRVLIDLPPAGLCTGSHVPALRCGTTVAIRTALASVLVGMTVSATGDPRRLERDEVVSLVISLPLAFIPAIASQYVLVFPLLVISGSKPGIQFVSFLVRASIFVAIFFYMNR